jgi:hypothetical protein
MPELVSAIGTIPSFDLIVFPIDIHSQCQPRDAESAGNYNRSERFLQMGRRRALQPVQ